MPLRIGLIGAGRHGSRYIYHILHDLPNLRLVALCRKRIGEETPWLSTVDIPIYGDYRALIADQAVEAIVVVTPPSLYPEICREAVKARKPLLIEKPLATTGREARAMVTATEEAGLLLMTAQTMRFDSAILLVKNYLPKIGRLRYATFTSRVETRTGFEDHAPIRGQRGVLLELGIHLLDLVPFLTDEQVVAVRCELDQLPTAAPDTMAIVQVKTESGISCVLDIARVVGGRVGRTEWVGTQGQIAADWIQHRVTGVFTHLPMPSRRRRRLLSRGVMDVWLSRRLMPATARLNFTGPVSAFAKSVKREADLVKMVQAVLWRETNDTPKHRSSFGAQALHE